MPHNTTWMALTIVIFGCKISFVISSEAPNLGCNEAKSIRALFWVIPAGLTRLPGRKATVATEAHRG